MLNENYSIVKKISKYVVRNKQDIENLSTVSKNFNESIHDIPNIYKEKIYKLTNKNCIYFSFKTLIGFLEIIHEDVSLKKFKGVCVSVFEKYFKTYNVLDCDIPSKYKNMVFIALIKIAKNSEILDKYMENRHIDKTNNVFILEALRARKMNIVSFLIEKGFNQDLQKTKYDKRTVWGPMGVKNADVYLMICSMKEKHIYFDLTTNYLDIHHERIDELIGRGLPEKNECCKTYASGYRGVPCRNYNEDFPEYDDVEKFYNKVGSFRGVRDYFKSVTNIQKKISDFELLAKFIWINFFKTKIVKRISKITDFNKYTGSFDKIVVFSNKIVAFHPVMDKQDDFMNHTLSIFRLYQYTKSR